MRTPRSQTQSTGRRSASDTLIPVLLQWCRWRLEPNHISSVFEGLRRSRLELIHVWWLVWWQVRWSAPVSTTVTLFSVEHPPRTSGSCSGSSMLLARVVSGTRRSDHITPVLARLHWLPVAARITFKIALLTFKAITTKKPEYLAEMLDFQAPPKTLSIVLEKPSACERCQNCFPPVTLSAMPHPQSGTISRLTWLTCLWHRSLSKNNLKLICTINPTVTDSPPVRTCDSVLSYI